MDPMLAAPEAEMIPPTDAPRQDIIPRTPNLPPVEREALVQKWQAKIAFAKTFWGPSFDKMRADSKFAAGLQWPDQAQNDDRYVANIVLRHIKHRTAGLYGRNPRTIARRKERLYAKLWDGTMQSLQQAQQTAAMAAQAQADPFIGLTPEGQQMIAAGVQAQALVMDAMQAIEQTQLVSRVAKTLELVYAYSLDEQSVPFKDGMKDIVRRSLTTGVGYAKVGFQRAMARKPETERAIADYSERLATIERLAADIADGETPPDNAEAEQLRLAIQALAKEPEVVTREGLMITYPDSTALIPDPKTKRLKNFVNADWVAEEFLMSGDEIKETYQVDVATGSSGAKQYQRLNSPFLPVAAFEPWAESSDAPLYCVYEVYSKKDGLVYVVCDGHNDFLTEPCPPDVYTERFWPWFALVLNETYHPGSIFPVSDVRLIRDMQLEMNRSRQGLREHRIANRPKMVVSAGALDEEDIEKLQNHPANAILELNGLTPGQSVDQLLQPLKPPPIDPALYDVNGVFQDILRVAGAQEANLGGTSGASATETSIAEGSRMSGQTSDVDELDELLSGIAHTAGQILLLELSDQTVVELVGPGAVWPQVSRASVAKDIMLEVEAGSTGRPNKQSEVQNATQLVPILMQIPGISPEWLAREMIRRLDDRLDLTDAIAAGMPSIAAMNRTSQIGTGGPDSDPNQQGDRGGDKGRTEPRRPNGGGPTGPTPPSNPQENTPGNPY
jgi:hypothetical protein